MIWPARHTGDEKKTGKPRSGKNKGKKLAKHAGKACRQANQLANWQSILAKHTGQACWSNMLAKSKIAKLTGIAH